KRRQHRWRPDLALVRPAPLLARRLRAGRLLLGSWSRRRGRPAYSVTRLTTAGTLADGRALLSRCRESSEPEAGSGPTRWEIRDTGAGCQAAVRRGLSSVIVRSRHGSRLDAHRPPHRGDRAALPT